jgi:hypothetical protein
LSVIFEDRTIRLLRNHVRIGVLYGTQKRFRKSIFGGHTLVY